MLGNVAYHDTQPQWKAVLKDGKVRAEEDRGGLLKTESSNYPIDLWYVGMNKTEKRARKYLKEYFKMYKLVLVMKF